jgi:signal transduction histidine kinase
MKIKSFKSQILLYLVLFSIVPLIFGISIILYEMYKSKKESIYNKHFQIIKQIESEADGIITDIEYVGEYVKKKYPTMKHHVLVNVPKIQKNISTILILNNKGILVDFYSSIKSNIFKGYDYSNKNLFRKIKNGAKSYWSEVYHSTITQKPVISYSLKIDENSIAVLIIDLESLNNFAKRFKSLDGSHMVRIADKNGIYLAHPDKPDFVLQRKNIFNTNIYKKIKNNQYRQLIFKSLTGKKNIGIHGTTKKLKWHIIVRESYEFLFKKFNTLILFLVLFILILSFVSIYFAKRLSKSIIRPLDEFSNEINNITHGKYSETINQSDYIELNKLISNFIIMQDEIIKREKNLESFNKKLEQKVDEKTLELKQINETLEDRVKFEVAKNIEHEKQIIESMKMVQMGEMIGNIAHQWRQPLNVISTSASGLKLSYEFGNLEQDDIPMHMDSIVQSTQYLSETIDIFRDFIKEKKELKDIVLQKRLKDILNILSAALKDNNITIQTNIDDIEEPIVLHMVSGELDQVIINIINNAKDILLEKNIADALIKLELTKYTNYVLITIEDNGGGIPKEILPKIFDPYFTTKHQSLGTGLGLHMSYQIITDSLKGKIYVKNTELGAKFYIELPLKED